VRAYRPTLSAAQVKHRLLATATRPAAQLPDPALGWGTVNPLSAVTAVLPGEGGSGRPAAVVPPDARGPGVTPRDEFGPVLAVAGVWLMNGPRRPGRSPRSRRGPSWSSSLCMWADRRTLLG
jgi:membrane-anchored mycosin MYCP